MKRSTLLLILVLFSPGFCQADVNSDACQIYANMQDGATTGDIQNASSNSNQFQTFTIYRGYRWLFDNGDSAYVEFDDNGNMAGQSDMHSVSQDKNPDEIEFNNDVTDHSLNLDQATNILNQGEFIEFDFKDIFSDGTVISGIADKNNNIVSLSIQPSCDADMSDNKSFQYSDAAPAPNNNVYEQSNVDTDQPTQQTVAYAAVYPYFLYAPYNHNNYYTARNNQPHGEQKHANSGAPFQQKQVANQHHNLTPGNTAFTGSLPTNGHMTTTAPTFAPTASPHPAAQRPRH